MSKAMKVEIWSDVMCPFCYIGKRRFEEALKSFAHKEILDIEWKAFQLDPTTKTDPSISIYKLLSEKKGIPENQARQMIGQVSRSAAELGLNFNFDKAIVANSYKAHQFSHFAKSNGVGIEAEEQLFKAYFIDGKNIDDTPTLISLGTEIGLNGDDLKRSLDINQYASEVDRDCAEARSMRVSGVPFFRINGRHAVSGAQDPQTFVKTLNKAYTEWISEPGNAPAQLEVTQGESCDLNGNCK
jgi:predicted DsbA family dithiol-disulfide isomerase